MRRVGLGGWPSVKVGLPSRGRLADLLIDTESLSGMLVVLQLVPWETWQLFATSAEHLATPPAEQL